MSLHNRPLPVTIISWLLIAAGIVGIAYHLPEFKTNPFSSDAILGVSIRLLAIICGVFMLRGSNWARWLALAWLAYHVAIGALHSTQQLLLHALLLVVIAFFLFQRRVTNIFARSESKSDRLSSSVLTRRTHVPCCRCRPHQP